MSSFDIIKNDNTIFGIGIFFATIIFFVFTQITEFDPEKLQPLDALYLGGPLITGMLAFVVAKKSNFRGVFGVSYFIFGIALFMYFIGESIFIYHEVVLGSDPYPSVADIFYGSFFFFAGFFILKNTRYFHPKFSVKYFFLVLGIIIVISTIYASISYVALGEIGFDFWYGLAFVIGSSTILGLAITNVIIFEHSMMGRIWGILAAGVAINTIADIWYYAHLELFEMYTGTHLVNSIWFCSWLVISYALLKQWKLPK